MRRFGAPCNQVLPYWRIA